MSIKTHNTSDRKYLRYLRNQKVSPLAKFLSINLKTQMEKWFSTRRRLLEEILVYLETDSEFQDKIKKIRQHFKIPKLIPKEDIRTIHIPVDEGESAEWEESHWLTGKSDAFQKEFEIKINSLLIEYHLPKNYYDWLQSYILYRKSSIPLYNPELISQVMEDPKEVQRIPLTTQEKNYLKWIVRKKLGIKRRPSMKLGKAYKELITLLSKSKNRQRRFRTLESSLQTLKQGQEEKYYDGIVGDDIKEKITYKRLAVDLYEDVNNDELSKAANKLRKQRQRLKERMQQILRK